MTLEAEILKLKDSQNRHDHFVKVLEQAQKVTRTGSAEDLKKYIEMRQEKPDAT